MIWFVVIGTAVVLAVVFVGSVPMGRGVNASDDRTAPLVPVAELPLAERVRRAHLEHVDRVRAAEELLDRAFSPPNPGRNP